MKINGQTRVWVQPNCMTDDHSLHGDAVALKCNEDGMVQVRFVTTVWVHEDHVKPVK